MAEFLPAPRTPGYLNPNIRQVLGDVLAMLQGRGPLADAQDGGSRGAGQGTSNYVVFPGNEDLLKILERK